LLRGDIRQDDLHELFFNMRAEAGGSGLVGEIASFLAHPDVRTQGIVTDEMRDQFAFLKFRIQLDMQRIITTDLPASVPNALRANLRRVRKTVLKSATNLRRDQAQLILETALARLRPTGSGGYAKLLLKDDLEFKVLRLLTSYSKGGPLFSDGDLFEDFCRALRRQKLLSPAEKQTLRGAKPAITLYALLAMHHRAIDLNDGTTAKAAIAADPRQRLAIYGFAQVATRYDGEPVRAAAWIFETGLRIADHCKPGIAPPNRDAFIGDFKLGPDLKLHPAD